LAFLQLFKSASIVRWNTKVRRSDLDVRRSSEDQRFVTRTGHPNQDGRRPNAFAQTWRNDNFSRTNDGRERRRISRDAMDTDELAQPRAAGWRQNA
jgi:hypothetical protein